VKYYMVKYRVNAENYYRLFKTKSIKNQGVKKWLKDPYVWEW
jgi:hypothetical protein